MQDWFYTEEASGIATPALLVYPERIEENILRMIRIAGSPEKLRPHVKTHKMSEVVKMQMKHGIEKFKCSTIAEAEMVALCGGKDIMLAMQPVGINIDRYFILQERFADVRFSAIVDSIPVIERMARQAEQKSIIAELWLDINNGMDRTGIIPGKECLSLFKRISESPFLHMRGLHVYDGHIHDSDPEARRHRCEHDYSGVMKMIRDIQKSGFETPVVVAGGTPTFPIHAKRTGTEVSPGTCVLWDSGYAEKFPDLGFLYAAILLMRVVSKPNKGLLCLDLGHKALAAEMPHPRVRFLNIAVQRFVNHSEEHLVIETRDADNYQPGDLIYGIPWHICPTVPRYRSALAISNGKIADEWKIDARDRMISI